MIGYETTYEQQMSSFEKLYPAKYRLTDIAPEHGLNVTLADFEQIIKNGFIQLEAE